MLDMLPVLDIIVSNSSEIVQVFPGEQAVRNQPANSGDVGSTPGLGRSPGERDGNAVQYSCRENPVDRAVWQATVNGVIKESI